MVLKREFVFLTFGDGGRQILNQRRMVLAAEVEELIASLKRQITALQAEVADLRRQLGQDSSNRSKPPSSDELKKKPRVTIALIFSSSAWIAGVSASNCASNDRNAPTSISGSPDASFFRRALSRRSRERPAPLRPRTRPASPEGRSSLGALLGE